VESPPSHSPFFLSPYKIDGFLVNKITCSSPIRKFAYSCSYPAFLMLHQKFVSPSTNRDGIFNFESSKKWTHTHTLCKKKSFLLPYRRVANSWLSTSRCTKWAYCCCWARCLVEGMVRRRPVDRTRFVDGSISCASGYIKVQENCRRYNVWTPYGRVYPKVSGLAAWSDNCKWHSSLLLFYVSV
jgi:hypothetical protein